ncbi:uncharacterized protein LOC115033847 isoform X2 [Acyrthosiphon pisum]|nr:uncharacterized protein LOC115033847 isoform X2 [Acyrthosiphon pisum]
MSVPPPPPLPPPMYFSGETTQGGPDPSLLTPMLHSGHIPAFRIKTTAKDMNGCAKAYSLLQKKMASNVLIKNY